MSRVKLTAHKWRVGQLGYRVYALYGGSDREYDEFSPVMTPDRSEALKHVRQFKAHHPAARCFIRELKVNRVGFGGRLLGAKLLGETLVG